MAWENENTGSLKYKMKIMKTAFIVILALLIVLLFIAAAVFLFLRFFPSVGKVPDKDEQKLLQEKSGQYDAGSFHNENTVRTMTGGERYSGDRKTPRTKLPAQTPTLLPKPGPGDLTFTWLGHSSFLLQIGGKTVLVDPVLSERSSPVRFAGPKRFSELPLKADDLSDADVVFISHDHYDHLDWQTIRTIKDRVGVFVVPLGIDAILRGWGVPEEKILCLDWWESAQVDDLQFTLTPSQHFSGRNPLKANSTLWGGVYISSASHRVYYTGDGGYYEVFGTVRERLGAPELMIAECGQYDPSWAQVHMFPEQTVQAGLDAGTSWLIPVHWGAFCICNHAWDDSVRRVTAAAEAVGLPIATPEIGQTVNYARIDLYTDAWWEKVQDN